MRHESFEMTLRYSHLSKQHIADASEVMARQLPVTNWSQEAKEPDLAEFEELVTGLKQK